MNSSSFIPLVLMKVNKLLRYNSVQVSSYIPRCSRPLHFSAPQCKFSPIIKTGQVSPADPVPFYIPRPPYAETGKVAKKSNRIEIKNDQQIKLMRKASVIARKVLNVARSKIKVGITTEEIDTAVHNAAIQHGAYPSPLNYKGFPRSCCTSVNNVIVHGIPDTRPLQDGDIVNVDVSVYLNGVHGDLSETFLVGDVDETGRHLVETCNRSLYAAIAQCRPGQKFNVIGKTISSIVEEEGFHVCPVFCGHGIGSEFHMLPDIFHFDNNYSGKMGTGMTFTIEPCIVEGTLEVKLLEDGWTYLTQDGSRAAQTEHTLLITESGVEILTFDFTSSTSI